MQTIELQLEQHSYPIYIGEDLLTNDELFNRHILGTQIFIVSNETIAPLYLSHLLEIGKNYQCDFVLLPDGEKYKTLHVLEEVFDVLIAEGHHRSTTIIALGGGVIGDMAGFAAACYQRGVNVIQVPTTLLAQVDAAIGGKTAVNHKLGKNMIGAFHQPQAVISDISVLETLPEREFRAGMAEVIKYGLLADATLFNYLEENANEIIGLKRDKLQHIISRCAQIKAQVVGADEKEAGNRALLNLGHTFGHAIENATNYSKWLHGEAVAIGMVCAARLSAHLELLSHNDVERIIKLLEQYDLPCQRPRDVSIEQMMTIMARDKKVINNKLRYVLLKSIGQAFVTAEVSAEQVIAALQV